jgi:hypothetical protein
MATGPRRLATVLAAAAVFVGITSLPAAAAAPAIRISDAQVLEGAGGYHYLAFTVRLANATGKPVTVGYSTADGTARVGGHDYAPARGEVTFHGRKVTKKVYVPVEGDHAYEATERFTVVLRKISGRASVKDGTGVGSIVNDDPGSQPLTVTIAGNGNGTVASDPAGVTCGVDCTQSYLFNTMVTLTATPASGSTFGGWSGGGCTGQSTCSVTMTQARTVTATFDLATFTLTVVRSGAGSGTVTGTGINCGLTCTASYPFNTMVTLTATPASGSTFGGWSGGGCTGLSPCTVTMSQAQTVDAAFDPA